MKCMKIYRKTYIFYHKIENSSFMIDFYRRINHANKYNHSILEIYICNHLEDVCDHEIRMKKDFLDRTYICMCDDINT